jgi:hypothetical protein
MNNALHQGQNKLLTMKLIIQNTQRHHTAGTDVSQISTESTPQQQYIHQQNILVSTTGPTRCTICFQFITINSLYMFRALISSSSGGTVYTAIGIFCAYYVGWLVAGLECSKHVKAINRI